MIDPGHLLEYVIRPVLKELNAYSQEAERLVLGTACVESECGRWLHQLGSGPAIGIYQMEPATHDDIWENFLVYNNDLRLAVTQFTTDYDEQSFFNEMHGNLYYATAMCRVHYLRCSDPIPDNLLGQAAYWKQFYNTSLGAGTINDYILAWRRFVIPEILAV